MLYKHRIHSEDQEKPEDDPDVETGRTGETSDSEHSVNDIEAVGNEFDAVNEKKASHDLKRTTSNILERVASRVTTRSIRDPGPPPDGGVKAWTMVACGWIVIFATWGYVNSFGIFQSYYSQTLSESASTVSWIGSIQVFLTFFIGAFSGRLLDAGLFLPTFVVGMILQLAGMFLMAESKTYWQLMLTQGVLTGVGGGIFFCPSMALVATYFEKKRALAIGLATTGNAVGGIIYPLITRSLLPQIGFPWTARVLGFLNLALLLVVLIFMRPRLPPRTSGPIIEWKAFTEPPFAFFCIGIFFVMWTVYYTFYYVASFGINTLGMEYSTATTLVIIVNGVGVPARVIPPIFADRVGPLNLVLPALFLVAIVSFTWPAVSSEVGFYIWTAFFGVTTAAFQCLIPTTVASLTPNLNMIGTRLGMFFSCLSFAALTGPPIGGALQAAAGGRFIGAQLWAAISALICALLVFCARVWKVGWKLKVRC